VPDGALDVFGGVPADDEAIADDLQHMLFPTKYRPPTETPRYVKELMMKWHHLTAPMYS
jgi:hypothetical protein